MNFRRGMRREEPEINLVPMIDVLLVILIFLMITTSYSRFSEMQINLPQAAADKPPLDRPGPINVMVDAAGRYLVNNTPLAATDTEHLTLAMRRAAGSNHDPVVIINADANAAHQSVIRIMEAARNAGYSHITFATQSKSK